jgi:hypothetical protein
MPTTTPQVPDFLKDLIPQMIQAFSDATTKTYYIIWDIFMIFLVQNWLWVIMLLVLILLFAFLEYLMTGRWANFGSILYSYTYYGILFIIGLIFGPDIFANNWIDLILFIVYVVSFLWVRIVLNRSGIRRHW